MNDWSNTIEAGVGRIAQAIERRGLYIALSINAGGFWITVWLYMWLDYLGAK